MKVLVGCEYSGVVRDAFIHAGHDAMSCDLLPTESPGPHYQGDIRDVLGVWVFDGPVGYTTPIKNSNGWDLLVAHPPCTHLSVSGARWFAKKREDGKQQEAVAFFMSMVNAPIRQIAVENPVCIMSRLYRKPDQIIQPWQFGHGETKATCLWLKGLPKLVPTNIVDGRNPVCWKMGPSPDRAKLRAKTYQGIADAMAEQWGCA